MMDLVRKSYLALNTVRSIYHDPYRSINTDTLKRLADALDVPILDLVEEVPDQDKEGKRAPSNDASKRY